jgi:hypothetical protein
MGHVVKCSFYLYKCGFILLACILLYLNSQFNEGGFIMKETMKEQFNEVEYVVEATMDEQFDLLAKVCALSSVLFGALVFIIA